MSKIPKFCWGCGNQLKDSQKFCTRCGKPVKIKNDQKQPSKSTNTSINAANTKAKQIPATPTPPQNKDYRSEYSSLQGYPQKTQRQDSSAYGQTQKITPTRKEVQQPVQPIRQEPQPPVIIAPSGPMKLADEDIGEIRDLNKTITDLDLEKRFKTIEYKINALNVENELLDLENKVDELKLQIKPSEPIKIPDNLATKEDLAELSEKISQIDVSKLNDMDKLSKLDKLDELEKIDELSQKLQALDKKMSNLDSAEKISNLAKNTVTRLNKMEKRINEFNIENRQRLVKLDERVEEMTQKMDHVNQAVDAILPALLKLTEKVNDIQTQSKVTKIKAQKKTVVEKAKKASEELDLPPFPTAEPKVVKKEPKAKANPST